jgi:hypothetical protein
MGRTWSTECESTYGGPFPDAYLVLRLNVVVVLGRSLPPKWGNLLGLGGASIGIINLDLKATIPTVE